MSERRPWSIQLASDVVHDGLGAELLDAGLIIRVVVFRCDADNTVSVIFEDGERPPLGILDWFFSEAATRLGCFEDGSPLPERGEWRERRGWWRERQ